jgi:hypothetical protein
MTSEMHRREGQEMRKLGQIASGLHSVVTVFVVPGAIERLDGSVLQVVDPVLSTNCGTNLNNYLMLKKKKERILTNKE